MVKPNTVSNVIRARAVARSENLGRVGGARSTVVGIICPPG